MAEEKTIRENGIVFRLNEDLTATAVQYMGGQFGTMAIVIPETVQGHTVTGIDSGVFRRCDNIGKLSIPRTVTYIGFNALPKCRKEVEKVCVGEKVIGYDYFQGCIKHTYYAPEYENVTKEIPVVQIVKGSYAERYCKDNKIRYMLE